jgi:hypothetical protein
MFIMFFSFKFSLERIIKEEKQEEKKTQLEVELSIMH